MKKRMKFSIFLQLFLLTNLSTCFGTSSAESKTNGKGSLDYEVCRTNECKNLAEELKNNMNSSVKPCEDFYQYACGGWVARNPIPDNELHIYQFTKIKNSKNLRLLGILEEYEEKGEIMESFRKAHAMYRSCLNTDAIERRGLKPIIDILNKNGGWPIMKSVSGLDRKFTWQKIVVNYIDAGFETLFDVIVASDFVQRTQRYFSLVPIDNIVFNRATNESHYRDVIKRVMTILSPGIVKTKQMDDDINSMIKFERDLMNMGKSRYKFHFDKYKISTIEEWQILYNKQNPKNSSGIVNWLDFFNSIAKSINKKLDKASRILLPPFNIPHLVSLLDRTSPRTIINYIHWKFLFEVMPYATESMREIAVELRAKIGSNLYPRKIECILNLEIDHALAYKYVKKYFSQESKKTIEEMVEKMKGQMAENIKKAIWLNEDEKKLVLSKFNKMESNIGYPDWYTPREIDKYYKELIIGENYLDNILATIRFQHLINFRNLDAPLDPHEWSDSPLWEDACYDLANNKMLFPAMILQKPFFESEGVPLAVMYGSFGALLGHEMTHSFDTWGSFFDEYAKFRIWWSAESYRLFTQKTECFREQYRSYIAYKPTNMTGFSDLYDYEEIADSVGIQAAFDVFKTLTKNKRDIRLSGLENISGDQLFFLIYARIHCGAEKPEYFTSGSAEKEGHDVPFLRVRGALSNMKSFSDTFGCAPRSFLNPDKKCSLWE